MPVNVAQKASQPTISSFFKSSPQKSNKRRPGSPVEVDLTVDSGSDAEPPAKKLREISPNRNLQNSPADDRGTGTARRWGFTPISPATSVTSARQLTEAEAISARERHEAFKKKLLLENNPFLRKTPHVLAPIEVEETESSGGESDQAFKELSSMFSNKAKGKAKVANSITPTKKLRNQATLGPSGQSYTPLENQIVQLKKENPGTVLMVEVGYKFKFFGDDAKVAAKELGMVAFNDRNFLVASIPFHRCNVHLKKLLAQGYRVGIVKQMETAALKKASQNRNTPFERKLSRLYTAATYVDELDSVDDLERYMPPPFMCLIEEPKGKSSLDVSIGLIVICPSTGDIVWDDFEDSLMRIELETRLVHTRPTELLLPKKGLSAATSKVLNHFSGTSTHGKIRIEHFEEPMAYVDAFSLVSDFYTDKTKSAVASESFRTGRLMAEVADFPKRIVVALAHAIKYLSAFSIADAFLETKFFSKFTTKAHMLLAANTLTNLEIYRNETDQTTHGSLLWVLDRTKTKFGARLLRNWIGRPLVDQRILEDRIDAVEEILASSSDKLVTLRQILKRLPDLAKGLCRIQYGQLTPQELAILLPAFNKISSAFDVFNTPADVGFKSGVLNNIIYCLPKLKGPLKEFLEAVSLKHAAEGKKDLMWSDADRYPGIADAALAIQCVEVELMDELKAIRKLLRLPSLQWATIAGDEYLVEVKRSDNRPIPDHWQLHSRTKHFARYQPPSVRQKVEERLQYQETLQAEANKAFSSFLEEIALNLYSVLRDVVNKLATADCLLSFALVALQDNYVRPTFTEEDRLEIVNGRHPMVESLRSDPFVPNTILMGGGIPRNKIITGPNMGGKSSCVRMIALIAIMAQIGSYVPAELVKLKLLDSVLTRMGASDDLARGRSTFMVEMSETSEILHSATPNSLVILDELGRGTSTFDGMAIADAVMEHLVDGIKCKTLFITHYPLVASNLESQYPMEVQNLHMGYEEDSRIDGTREITFLYRLLPGMATESFGIECGRLAGLPEAILSVASKCGSKLQNQVEERKRRNRIFRSAHIVADCSRSRGVMAISKLQDLRNLINGGSCI